MATPNNVLTSVRLLAKLAHDPDPKAWSQFFDRYRPLMLAWCRRCGLQEADAEDVVSGVLIKLMGALRTYNPERGFRKWLSTVVRNAVRDFFRAGQRRGKQVALAGDIPDTSASVEDLIDVLAGQIESDQQALQAALDSVRARVKTDTWEAFRLHALEGQTASEAAAELHLKPSQIYIHKYNVTKMLKEELQLRGFA